MTYQYQEWPKWMYGPNNQSRIFNKDDQIPKGWADHPDKVGKKQKKEESQPKGEPTPEERAETIASIREAGVAISDDATIEEINAAIDALTAKD